MARFGTFFGPNLPAGEYDVLLIKGRDTFPTRFVLAYDPDAPYTKEDREVQRQTTLRLYNLSETCAWLYEALAGVRDRARTVETEDAALAERLTQLADRADEHIGRIVALEGDGYVAEGEELYERISQLYRLVSSYPGRPSDSQVERAVQLEGDFSDLEKSLQPFLTEELLAVNEALDKAGLPAITYLDKETFLGSEAGSGGSDSGGGRLFWKGDEMYRVLTGTPLGHRWLGGL